VAVGWLRSWMGVRGRGPVSSAGMWRRWRGNRPDRRDREPWLAALRDSIARVGPGKNVVLLVRAEERTGEAGHRWDVRCYLKGSYELIASRLRRGVTLCYRGDPADQFARLKRRMRCGGWALSRRRSLPRFGGSCRKHVSEGSLDSLVASARTSRLEACPSAVTSSRAYFQKRRAGEAESSSRSPRQ